MFDTTFDRKTAIGASEAAAILGLSPYQTPFGLWLLKTGQTADTVDNAFTRAGNALEPVIGDLYSQRTGEAIRPFTATVRHPAVPCVAATPDFEVPGAGRLVETKAALSVHSVREYGDEASGVFPARHAVQCMIQMACLNANDSRLAALVNGELRVYRVDRDLDAERGLLDTLNDWWERHMVRGEAPAVDGSPVVHDWLVNRFPRHGGGMLTADAAVADTMDQMFRHRAMIEAFEAGVDRMKNELCQIIADKDGIEAPGIGRVTWKRTKDTEHVDWKAVAQRLARDIAEEYGNTSEDAGKELLEDVAEKFTTTKPGTRRFVMTEDEKDG